MSRLKAEVVVEREALATKLFTENPKMTGEAVNEILREKYGKQMRLKRIFEIKRSVTQAATPAPVATPVVAPTTPATDTPETTNATPAATVAEEVPAAPAASSSFFEDSAPVAA